MTDIFINQHYPHLSVPPISNYLDIPNLPWKGNHAADEHLFRACDAYIASIKGNTGPARRLRHQAEYLTTLHGMGIVIGDVL